LGEITTNEPSLHPKLATSKVSDQDILQEIGNIGAGQATIALSTMLHEKVNVEVPKLYMTPPHLVPKIYQQHDTLVAAIFMQLRGEAECDIMLIFQAKEANKIGALMAKEAAGKEADSEMKKSAIEELGSIMICSFLNAVATFTDMELVPTPPTLICDAFDAVIDGLLVKQALCSDIAAIFDSRFRRAGSTAEGYLLLFPGENLRKMIIDSGKSWLEDGYRKNGFSKSASQPLNTKT
jgi:chemotaxis protein CheC